MKPEVGVVVKWQEIKNNLLHVGYETQSNRKCSILTIVKALDFLSVIKLRLLCNTYFEYNIMALKMNDFNFFLKSISTICKVVTLFK